MATFLGLDIGTSSVKAVLVDERQASLAEHSVPLEVARPHPLWSEQDPGDWWDATLAAVAALRRAAPAQWAGLAGIGLSGQQHGATLLDARGEPLRPCILWNDGRAQGECAELARRVPDLAARTSNIAMPGFTAPKLLWVARHEPEIFAKTAMILLPKDFVRHRLTGACVSDMSDAAGTLWLDVKARRWDATLLAACGLSAAQMPGLVEGSACSAMLSPELAAQWGLAGRAIPVAGGGGDNACSAIGIGAVNHGDGFLSLGTSGVIFAATDRPVAMPERTMHAFCHALPGRWHAMTVMLSAGAALDWIAGVLGQGDRVAALLARVEEAFASDRARDGWPVFLPYLTGERTPHNDPLATAGFGGLAISHGPEAITHAVLEGVAFALADCLDVLAAADAAPRACMLVGGGSRSPFWAQLIADATGLTLDLPEGAAKGAAFGAARLAMMAAGASADEVCAKPKVERSFVPDLGERTRLQARRKRAQALHARQT